MTDGQCLKASLAYLFHNLIIVVKTVCRDPDRLPGFIS